LDILGDYLTSRSAYLPGSIQRISAL
jgi:hypothetical protein